MNKLKPALFSVFLFLVGTIYATNIGYSCSASASCGDATVSCSTNSEGATCVGKDDVGVRCGTTKAVCTLVDIPH